jgi:hypothetical protein
MQQLRYQLFKFVPKQTELDYVKICVPQLSVGRKWEKLIVY